MARLRKETPKETPKETLMWRTLVAPAACLVALVLAASAAAAADRGRWGPVPDGVWRAMQGTSWHPGLGCPARSRLALLWVPHVDFGGVARTGEMIVARDAANAVLDVFAQLKRAGFRIYRMQLVHRFGGDDLRSMSANNTSAFNCRRTTGASSLSAHATGHAIDINPVQNPYVSRRRVLPPAGRAFASQSARARPQTGMIRRGDLVTRAFARIGWKWRGYRRSPLDYQHFSRSGR